MAGKGRRRSDFGRGDQPADKDLKPGQAELRASDKSRVTRHIKEQAPLFAAGCVRRLAGDFEKNLFKRLRKW
jgi:hypothetical protein